jgi:hypothetical protein
MRRQQDERDESLGNVSEALLGATDGVAILDGAGQPVTDTALVPILAQVRPLEDEPPIAGRHGLRARVLRGERVVGRYELPGSGRARRVEIVGDPIRDAVGEVVGALITMRPARRGRSRAG